MNLNKLGTVSLDEAGVRFLAALPAPENISLQLDSIKLAFEVQNNLYKLWQQLLLSPDTFPTFSYEWRCKHGHKHIMSKPDLYSSVFLSIAGYFDYILQHCISLDNVGKCRLPNCLVMNSIQRFIPKEDEQGLSESQKALRLLSFDYFTALFCVYFFSSFKRLGIEMWPMRHFEYQYHECIHHLFTCLSLRVRAGSEQIAARRLIGSALGYASSMYKDLASWKPDHKPSVFSAIKLDQLNGLASRDRTLVSRYGDKHVDRIFEQQLSLIMQSLGTYVAATKSGQSTVDLLCISRSPTDHFSFLVEAKTSKRPYSLPKKDSRAIRDYVSDMRKTLSTLPPLAFVLIVGQEATKRINTKLRQLEMEAGIPVRFVHAKWLADLRERLPGPLSLQVFHRCVVGGSLVLGGDFSNEIVESARSEQQAHEAFVTAMLVTRGIIPASPKQWAPDPHAQPEQGRRHEEAVAKF